MSDNTETVAQHCWSMARRVGLRIAELPVDMREMAFAGAEHCLRAAGSELGIAGPQLDSLTDLQMKAIRQIVTDIDVSERRGCGPRANDLSAARRMSHEGAVKAS